MIKIYTFILSLLFFLAMNMQTSAEVIPAGRAKKVAANFIQQKNTNLIISKNIELSLRETIYQDDLPAIYLFQVNPEGFIIISAESNTYPVLGYSPAGSGIGVKPPALEAWMDSWKTQIGYIRDTHLTATDVIYNAWSDYSITSPSQQKVIVDEVQPLLNSKWGQHVYYNAMCPADPDGPGGHALAGCVAIAMAQVMFYFRYPETGLGSHGYFSDYGYEFVDFGNTTYHWNEMVNAIYNMSNLAIAELIYHVGVSVEMDYSATGSGSTTQDAANAMKMYFRYGEQTTYLNRFDVPDTFKDSLIHCLDQQRPCIVRGGDLSGSHSFVCDGYQDSLYFHFNWGWNGNWDGYYFIDNLNPGGYDFTFNQGAIINIYPGEDYPLYCQQPDTLKTQRGTFTDGSGPENYPDNSNCSWLISPQGGEESYVMVWFPDFDLEDNTDFIYLYDGNSSEDPLIAVITGSSTDSDYSSTGTELFIVFESDAQGTEKGWQAEYITIDGPWCNDLTTYTEISRTWFSDLSGPYPYAANSDCHWMISPQEGEYDSISGIEVFFHEFDLAEGDTLFFIDANNPLNPVIEFLTGTALPEPIMINTNKLDVNFRTDAYFSSSGWGAGYNSILPVFCQDTIIYNEKTGLISDGSGQKKYVNNSNCYWLIEYETAEVITITFSEFELEWGYDQLRILDASVQPPVILKTLWGDVIPEPIYVESNRILINFISDESTVFEGWTLNYEALAPGIPESGKIDQFSISPNPVNDLIRITGILSHPGQMTFQIYDLMSVKISEQAWKPKDVYFEKTIGVASLANGVYIMRILTADGVVSVKFLKH